ncbi:TonB-dependent receptor [Myroides pelagicus]|uniref:TonB-dependent receptor plug domain-containing protein n=1 Tax=Myroides pelagicus TaxID=270914 RepID=A0A7K1GIU2_9FLAO|nr:TonB-dependent receptor [Myroides pelagicus]MTH28811.1 TonB-dependent receptor plug domain-containing protein [Myroides pelagicus]
MKALLSLLLLLFFGELQAQKITLSGTVFDVKNKPIENVNVYLKDSFEGVLSDANGHFSFVVEDTLINDVLVLIHHDFEDIEEVIVTRESYHKDFVMLEKEGLLGEIIIKTKSKRKRERVESIDFSAMDVVSTAGSPGNIVGVIGTMPGAQVNGEDGRLMIRGGKADESGIYVNGIRVFEPYTATVGNVPVRSKFNPFLFKGMSFLAGGYSAEFGEALSGVLQLDTADDIDASRKDVSISILGGSFGQTHQWGKNSLSYHLNYLNLGAYTALVKQRYDSQKPFSTASAEVVFKRELKEGGYKLYTAIDYSSMAYRQEMLPSQQVDTLALQSMNVYLNSLYFKRFSPYLRLDVGTGVGYVDYTGDKNERHIGKERWDLSQKIKMSYQWNGNLRSFIGADVQLAQLDLTKGMRRDYENRNFYTTRFALFFESDWNLRSGFSLRMGVRANKYSAISNWTLEPRTMLTFQLNAKQQLSFSYGVFNQAMNLEQGMNVKQEDWMQANHYILNYTYEFKKRMLRAEVFCKDYSKLLLTPIGKTNEYSQLGEGYAKGFDLFWKDNSTFKNFEYWITYTYIDSKRKEMYWNEWIQPSYIAKHDLSVVTKYWIEQWKLQVSMTYHYATPREFYAKNAADKLIYKSSAIHDVSLSWAYLLSAQKILYASVNNLLGRHPVYAYQFAQQGGQPDQINASATRFVYIGFMWTISSNKKLNQLDNL